LPASFPAGSPGSPAPISSTRAVGWNLAERAMELHLEPGSRIDLAYRIRENDHPDFGGLEIEIMGMRPASDGAA
jgi:single-stranded-DNA-specific exonuclease